ncbi:hypothetical protein Mgra_00000918 [Meloidogyne graminicola]|uniref:Uncharacterized protein n=1 Tax=Meloidogyne graminicola TaxID=189291 RepID=A0A8T0A0N2_9BILA|nr:hypothetical protein Mgra_00000918 [Meloidogyne graminicola]
MFIIRYWLDKLFNCTFENSEFDNIIINSELIQLLFENENNKNLIKFRTNNTKIRYFIRNFENQAMKLIKENVLIFNEFTFQYNLNVNIEQYNNIILNILKEGDKFPSFNLFGTKPSIIELIINYLKTSTNYSNFVSKIEIIVHDYSDHFWTFDKLINMADKTTKCIYLGKYLYYSKLKIININNPKIIYLLYYMFNENYYSHIKFIFKRK